jgi:hypothetical protein
MLAVLQSKGARIAMGVLALAGLTGCPDTEGVFNDFGERYALANPGGDACSGVCTMPPAMAGDGDGAYIFALSPILLPEGPLLFDTQMTVTDGPNGLQFTWLLQPLDRCDRMSPVGDPITIGPIDLAADGSFTAMPPPLSVTDGAANPLSGNPLVADIDLTGLICLSDFSSGDLTGTTIDPPGIKLDGSTWTLEPLAMPGVYPDPVKINCAGDPYGPPPPACP